MIADGRQRGGRHRREPDGGPGSARNSAGWRRALAAVVSVGVAAFTVITLSSPAGAAQTLAKATLVDVKGNEVGKVAFKGFGKYAERVRIDITAAAGGGTFHGLHIHDVGDCNPAPTGTSNMPFTSAGPHYNPDGTTHGSHRGDLPSVLLTPDGQAYAEFETARVDVDDLLAGNGSAVVLHAGPDNFANIPTTYRYLADGLLVNGPNSGTLGTGDAGDRYACGVLNAAN